jgi:hypothetical protein
MSQEPPKFQYYKVEGDGLELLKAYKAELEALVDDRQRLEKEFAERAEQQAEYHQANLRAMWRRLSASVGLDPDTTWGSPEFQIEARYIDDGFGAILYMPRHTNPLRDMLGGEPVGQPQDPATDVPPKDTTRH